MMLFEMLSYPFLARAFVVGVLVSLCSALLGTSLVLKRYSMIGDGLSHVGFGALAIASAFNLAPLAVAVPVVVAAAILLLRRKKKPSAPIVPVTPAPVKRPSIRSYSKANYGVRVQLSGQPVMIGRGSGCAMRFPQNTPGVSGSHCTVQWDEAASDFIVTDLNSSYGTFLMTGQKMAANVPYRLRAGDKFYLADQNHVIGLELE